MLLAAFYFALVFTENVAGIYYFYFSLLRKAAKFCPTLATVNAEMHAKKKKKNKKKKSKQKATVEPSTIKKFSTEILRLKNGTR